MGVGIQHEACGEVAEHSEHGLDIQTVLQCDGSGSVAEVMEPDLGDTFPCQNSLQYIIHKVQ